MSWIQEIAEMHSLLKFSRVGRILLIDRICYCAVYTEKDKSILLHKNMRHVITGNAMLVITPCHAPNIQPP